MPHDRLGLRAVLTLALLGPGCTVAAGRAGRTGAGVSDGSPCVTPTGESCEVPACADPCSYNDPSAQSGACVITEVPDSCGDLRGIEVRFLQVGATVPAPGGVFRPADASLQKWVQARWQEMSQFVVPAAVNTQLTQGGVKVWNYPDGNGWIRTDFHAGIMALPKGRSPDQILAALRDDPVGSTGSGEFAGWVGWPVAGPGGRKVGDRVDLDIFGPDNGAIGYWKIDPDRFCVITLQNDTAGIHPVNGIRCWGYVPIALNPNWLATNGGQQKWGCAGPTYMFYTMGIDSPSVAGGGMGADAQAATWNALIRDLLAQNARDGGVSGNWYQQKTIVQPNDLAPGAAVSARPPGEMSSYYVELPEPDFRDGELCEDPAAPAGECADDEFTCVDGACIAAASRCDGIADCTDRDDEDACDAAPTDSCAATQFACADGTCLPGEWQCDGEYADCPDGDDEHDCGGTTPTCAADQFACEGGTCLPAEWQCDGLVDCDGGEDEVACPEPEAPDDGSEGPDDGPAPCTGDTCDDGTCLPDGWTCDGIVDCDGGEDELYC